MKQIFTFVFDASMALLVLALTLQASGLLAVAGFVLFALNALGILAKVFGYKSAVVGLDGRASISSYYKEKSDDRRN